VTLLNNVMIHEYAQRKKRKILNDVYTVSMHYFLLLLLSVDMQ